MPFMDRFYMSIFINFLIYLLSINNIYIKYIYIKLIYIYIYILILDNYIFFNICNKIKADINII